MPYSLTLRGLTHTFPDLRRLLAKASPARSGDDLAQLSASSAEERVIAQLALAEVPLQPSSKTSSFPTKTTM